MALAAAAIGTAGFLAAKPTKSWWLQNTDISSVAMTPSLPDRADVVIIGAGLTGCATAFWLRRLFGRSSMVIDARGCAGGATGRNGGHLWSNPTSDFEQQNVRELLQFLEEEGVDCDLTQDGAVALERRNPEVGVVYHDEESDPERGLDGEDEDYGDTPLWTAEDCEHGLQTASFSAATLHKGAAQFFPAKVAAALLRSSKASLHAPVKVLAISHGGGTDGSHKLVQTEHGNVRARHVVVATNGWAAELLPELREHLYPCRNQVIMTKPLPATSDWQVGAFSVDSEVGARELYAIRRPDGRICLGGARALEVGAAVGSTDDATLSDEVGGYLRKFLDEHFSSLQPVEIEAEWTGILGFTRDRRPLIGEIRPGVFVAAGFCGHGMPQCTGAGKALAQMVEGGHDDELHPFVRGPANVKRAMNQTAD